MIILTWSLMPPGIAVRRSTPKGLSVAWRTAAISAAIFSSPMVDAPRQPKPPASETAAANSEYETPPMPANMTGCSIPSSSVRRVRMVLWPSLISFLHGLTPRIRRGDRSAGGGRPPARGPAESGGRLPMVAF